MSILLVPIEMASLMLFETLGRILSFAGSRAPAQGHLSVASDSQRRQ